MGHDEMSEFLAKKAYLNMRGTSPPMAETVLDLVDHLKWPVVVVFVVLLWRKEAARQAGKLVDRLRRGKYRDFEFDLQEDASSDSVAATVNHGVEILQHQLANAIRDLNAERQKVTELGVNLAERVREVEMWRKRTTEAEGRIEDLRVELGAFEDDWRKRDEEDALIGGTHEEERDEARRQLAWICEDVRTAVTQLLTPGSSLDEQERASLRALRQSVVDAAARQQL
ncbi:hypothetical protein [Kineosporia sp. R_H_3]|uniref:hypothetical protein n=1 Tax=Kineosporia sp. R_H_3 TaxID=1961848 RepID=UPI000B4A8D46|nr:hypothetical protein [Kineosporia sp. R_H_3]